MTGVELLLFLIFAVVFGYIVGNVSDSPAAPAFTFVVIILIGIIVF